MSQSAQVEIRNKKAIEREYATVGKDIRALFRVHSMDDTRCVFTHPYIVGTVTWECCLLPPYNVSQHYIVHKAALRPVVWTLTLEFKGQNIRRNYNMQDAFQSGWNTHKSIIVCIRNLIRDTYSTFVNLVRDLEEDEL